MSLSHIASYIFSPNPLPVTQTVFSFTSLYTDVILDVASSLFNFVITVYVPTFFKNAIIKPLKKINPNPIVLRN